MDEIRFRNGTNDDFVAIDDLKRERTIKMRIDRKTSRLWNALMAIVILAAMISLSVVFVLNFRPLYDMDMRLLDIPGTSGYPAEEIKANYDALIDYNSMFYTGTLEFPTLPQSEEAAMHFAEVKNIFVVFQVSAIATTILSVASLLYYRRKHPRRSLRYAGYMGLALPVVLGIGIALNWNRMFVLFHQVLFRNDYWLFDPATDPIILMLPDAYFMHCAIAILGLVMLGSVLCLLVGKRVIWRNR